jgi:hypothetical protein
MTILSFFGFGGYTIYILLAAFTVPLLIFIVIALIVHRGRKAQELTNYYYGKRPELYRIVYEKVAELTPEEELFVKRYSGSNEGKLRSAPEGTSYYTYDDMFSGSFSAQEQVQFAGVIEILEKEIEKHDYVEFVFDHEKKLGPINKNASTALYRIRYTLIAELTKEENAVINNPKFSGSSMFILDSAPTQLFYMDNTHLEAIVNMYGERKFERLVKILKAEIDKNEYCGCVDLSQEYV